MGQAKSASILWMDSKRISLLQQPVCLKQRLDEEVHFSGCLKLFCSLRKKELHNVKQCSFPPRSYSHKHVMQQVHKNMIFLTIRNLFLNVNANVTFQLIDDVHCALSSFKTRPMLFLWGSQKVQDLGTLPWVRMWTLYRTFTDSYRSFRTLVQMVGLPIAALRKQKAYVRQTLSKKTLSFGFYLLNNMLIATFPLIIKCVP